MGFVSIWELPTRLNSRYQMQNIAQPAVSQLMRYKMSNTKHMQRSKAYTAASIITHAQSKAVKQVHIRTSSLLSYNYNHEVPSNIDLTPAKPNTDTSSGTVAQKLRIGSYALNQICPTLLTQHKALNKAQDYRREMSRESLQLNASSQKCNNEASQQEEYSATTPTSVGAIYHQQSEKIRFGEQ
ncbi:hypothetical protein F511_35941 [Dorcoceras hygrometricum]|uniref:Uncharacterized protein n=1 Tax=Dorcoceras hygrometricum TaxID=472368 RepID=A0A2Z7B5X4_9LAMI|nr:hypothetical protein F511_35941 [Dorcoceras hygrometricum]